jgi:hypothetical protein
MTDTSKTADTSNPGDRFVSKLSALTIRDSDGNLVWKHGIRYQDGRPFTGLDMYPEMH